MTFEPLIILGGRERGIGLAMRLLLALLHALGIMESGITTSPLHARPAQCCLYCLQL